MERNSVTLTGLQLYSRITGACHHTQQSESTPMSECSYGGQRFSMQLELQALINFLKWVLGMQIRSRVRTLCPSNP